MTRLDRVKAIAGKHGVTLAEYLVLHIATAFVMTPEEAGGFVVKSLAQSPHADPSAGEAVKACLDKKWVGVSATGMLVLAPGGMALAHAIANELTMPAA